MTLKSTSTWRSKMQSVFSMKLRFRWSWRPIKKCARRSRTAKRAGSSTISRKASPRAGAHLGLTTSVANGRCTWSSSSFEPGVPDVGPLDTGLGSARIPRMLVARLGVLLLALRPSLPLRCRRLLEVRAGTLPQSLPEPLNCHRIIFLLSVGVFALKSFVFNSPGQRQWSQEIFV